MKCGDCKEAFEPSKRRPKHCARCDNKLKRREYYHTIVKNSVEKLAKHRELSRIGMIKINARRREAAL